MDNAVSVRHWRRSQFNRPQAEDAMDMPVWYLQCCIAALALYYAQEID